MTEHATLAAEFEAIGTTCRVLVTDGAAAAVAADHTRAAVAELDKAASRFRADSELSRFAADGLPHRVSPLLGEVVAAGLRTARLTDGLVDPTVGGAIRALGYDDDLAAVRARRPAGDTPSLPTPGWQSIRYDETLRLLAVQPGCLLDFGASAKAYLADRIAQELWQRTGTGVLVDLGGDLASKGAVPAGGWRIGVETADGRTRQRVRGRGQAFATSSTMVRTWQGTEGVRHHILDPRTGKPAPQVWQQVTVVGVTAVEANAASTASVILGADAVRWLTEHQLPALLVDAEGSMQTTPGWLVEVAA